VRLGVGLRRRRRRGGGGGGGGPVGDGAHTYWRVLWPGVTNGYAGVAEMEMRATDGGADQCSGGTPIASGYYESHPSFAPANAFDNSTSSEWAAQTTGGEAWLGYQFASPVEVRQVHMAPRLGQPEQLPRQGRFQFSDDGVSWTTAWEWQKTWSVADAVTRPTGTETAASRWRLKVRTANTLGAVDAAEIEFRATPGGADQATGGTAFATSFYGAGYEPAKAFDNSTATEWVQGGISEYDPAIGYQFAAPVTVQQVAYRARTGWPTHTPQAGDVQFGDDGVSWITCWTFSGLTSWPEGETKLITKPS
jgi:hypothetical protein